MKNLFGWLFVLCLVVACGGPDHGPELGPFAAINKQETDPPFDLTPPSSRSPAAFSYISSDTKVATISGARVTITGPGQTTITASQPSLGNFGPTQTTTLMTVAAVPCAAGETRVNGKCQPIPTCVPPAALTNNQCVAPPSAGTTVTQSNLTWMAATNVDKWQNASNFCSTSVISDQAGTSGWRLPTRDELIALYTSGAIAGKNWILGNTWTSTMGTESNTAGHTVVNLANGTVSERGDDLGAYVTCVH